MVAAVVKEYDDSGLSRFADGRSMLRVLRNLLVSVALIALAIWAIHANWPLKAIRFDQLVYTENAARRLASYPEAQYAYGLRAWIDQQPEKAALFFRKAVSRNVLHMDAWLRLAEAEAALGEDEKARAILTFVAQLTDQTLRWKWPQLVLAGQLGMDAIFYHSANDLLNSGVLTQDTLQLLHTHLDGDASTLLDILAPQNLAVYLDWLMRWGLVDESLIVWQAMTAAIPPDNDIALRYAHFLLGRKHTVQAADIWREYAGGSSGMTNPGFESQITGRGFDWRYWYEKEKNWELKRVHSESNEGSYALRLKFSGKQNIAFHHLYQIVAVAPEMRYTLSYAWKARGITTDQGPFVEIVGYDARDIYEKGPMLTGTHRWREDAIAFSTPADCHAVVVRLRRRTSMRFDSKIRGTIWLDNFRLKAAGIDPPDDAADEKTRFSTLQKQERNDRN